MTTPKNRDSATSRGGSPDKPVDLRPLSRLEDMDLSKYTSFGCSQKDVMIFKVIFEMINTEGNGMITPFEIRKALANYGGYKAKRKEIYKIIACWDIDLSGDISFKEFVRMMTEKLCERETQADIEKTFNEIDREQKGYITEEDLMDLAEEVGEEMSEDEVKEIIRKCDPTGQGRISMESFLSFNRQNSF